MRDRVKSAGPLEVTPATACAPYPVSASELPGTSSSGFPLSQPLVHQVPGHVFSVGLQDVFEILFCDLHPGSFQQAYLSSIGSQVQSWKSWDPAPTPGAASAVVAGKAVGEGVPPELPRRFVDLQRPVLAPAWVRYVLTDLPNFCKAEEEWTLHGLGEGQGFFVEVRGLVIGVPYTDCFLVWSRYRATALGKLRTQLDAEFYLQWVKSTIFQSRIECGTFEQMERDFKEKFLEAVRSSLAAALFQDPAPPNGAEPSPALGMQLSPQEWVLGLGSLDGSDFPDGSWADPELDETPCYELRVEVMAASVLEGVSDDIALCMSDVPWAAVAPWSAALCAEVTLGGRTVRTEAAPSRSTDTERSASWPEEHALFAYAGERELVVQVFDFCKLQAALGDKPALIGEARLPLDPQLWDLEPRGRSLALCRQAAHTGIVQVRYQLLVLCGGSVVCESLPRAPHLDAQAALLRVEVLSVWGLRPQQSAFRDLLSSMTNETLPVEEEEVTVELQLGPRRVQTRASAACSGSDGDRAAHFEGELVLFIFGGDMPLEVRVSSRTSSMVANDELLGEASLPLGQSVCDCEPRAVDLPFANMDQRTGIVSLRYQVFV